MFGHFSTLCINELRSIFQLYKKQSYDWFVYEQNIRPEWINIFCVYLQFFKRHPHKLVKHTQIICRQQAPNCLSEFDLFAALALKYLSTSFWYY